MSRRDTIIVAVLANAALLMILFATAVRSGDKGQETPVQIVQAPVVSDKGKKVLQKEIFEEYLTTTVPTLGGEMAEEIIFNELPLPEAVIDTPIDEIVAAPARESKPVQEIKQTSHTNNYANVTVKKGDFLEKIAKANETTVSAIMKANNLGSTQLKVGQVLKIPVKEGQNVRQSEQQAAQYEDYYVVKEGDNPWLIASRNQIKLEELLRLNGLDEQKARRLRPGDRLRIR